MERLIHCVAASDFRQAVFSPPMKLRDFRTEPLSLLETGAMLELRLPDGDRIPLKLKGFSIEGIWRGPHSDADDATFYSFPTDPNVRLRFRPRLTPDMAPTGSEIWLVDSTTSSGLD